MREALETGCCLLLNGDHYELQGVIGSGGTAIVYSAVRLNNGVRYAIKEIYPVRGFHREATGEIVPDDARDADYLRLIQRQTVSREKAISLLAARKSYQAIPVEEVCESGALLRGGVQMPTGNFYAIQKDVSEQGEPLRRWVRRKRAASPMHTISLSDALSVMLTLCAAVVPLHEAGTVHTDITVGNAFLRINAGEPNAALLDFGAAWMPEDRELCEVSAAEKWCMFYTEGFAAPELMEETEQVTPAADVWSLGVLFLDLLTDFLEKHRDCEELTRYLTTHGSEKRLPGKYHCLPLRADGRPSPEEPAVRAMVNEILTKCLNNAPAQRGYANAAELLSALRSLRALLDNDWTQGINRFLLWKNALRFRERDCNPGPARIFSERYHAVREPRLEGYELPLRVSMYANCYQPELSELFTEVRPRSGNYPAKETLLKLFGPGSSTRSCFVCGKSGSGKTMLAAALMNRRLQNGPVLYLDLSRYRGSESRPAGQPKASLIPEMLAETYFRPSSGEAAELAAALQEFMVQKHDAPELLLVLDNLSLAPQKYAAELLRAVMLLSTYGNIRTVILSREGHTKPETDAALSLFTAEERTALRNALVQPPEQFPDVELQVLPLSEREIDTAEYHVSSIAPQRMPETGGAEQARRERWHQTPFSSAAKEKKPVYSLLTQPAFLMNALESYAMTGNRDVLTSPYELLGQYFRGVAAASRDPYAMIVLNCVLPEAAGAMDSGDTISVSELDHITAQFFPADSTEADLAAVRKFWAEANILKIENDAVQFQNDSYRMYFRILYNEHVLRTACREKRTSALSKLLSMKLFSIGHVSTDGKDPLLSPECEYFRISGDVPAGRRELLWNTVQLIESDPPSEPDDPGCGFLVGLLRKASSEAAAMFREGIGTPFGMVFFPDAFSDASALDPDGYTEHLRLLWNGLVAGWERSSQAMLKKADALLDAARRGFSAAGTELPLSETERKEREKLDRYFADHPDECMAADPLRDAPCRLLAAAKRLYFIVLDRNGQNPYPWQRSREIFSEFERINILIWVTFEGGEMNVFRRFRKKDSLDLLWSLFESIGKNGTRTPECAGMRDPEESLLLCYEFECQYWLSHPQAAVHGEERKALEDSLKYLKETAGTGNSLAAALYLYFADVKCYGPDYDSVVKRQVIERKDRECIRELLYLHQANAGHTQSRLKKPIEYWTEILNGMESEAGS